MNEQLGQAMDAILTPEAADRLKRVELVRKEDAMKMKMKLIEMVGWASRLVWLGLANVWGLGAERAVLSWCNCEAGCVV